MRLTGRSKPLFTKAYQLAREGLIPVVRLGRQLRVDPRRLNEWMELGGSGLTPTREKSSTDNSLTNY